MKKAALRALVLLLFGMPLRADPVPGVSVDQAYALIRSTMLDFTSPPDAMLARMASLPGGRWDHVPLIIDLPADPQALRIRMALELGPDGSAHLVSRQMDCTRLGPAGLAAVNARQPLAPSQAFAAPDQAGADLALEALALQSLAETAARLAPDATGAVMTCTLTIALAPGANPAAALQALAAADFASFEVMPEGATDFLGGRPGPDGLLALLRVAVPTAEGQDFLYLSAFSAELRPDS